jgi:predicted ABC-type ATPase
MVKQIWILAGGNGAGKSTFYREYLSDKGLYSINADEIEKLNLKNLNYSIESSQNAQRLAMQYCDECIEKGISFCFETVFSHHSKLDLIQKAKKFSFEIILIYIHLKDSQLNLARVHQRVQDGGHSVPEEKILKKIPKTIINIQSALKIVDEARILDNSNSKSPFEQIAMVKDEKIQLFVKKIPQWAKSILDEF